MTSPDPALIALPIFLFPLAYSPGPGNMFFAAQAARFGLRATLRPTLGYHLATLLVTFAIGLGMGGLFGASSALFQVVRAAGAAYVLWLALKLMRAGRIGGPGDVHPAGFADGAVLLVLNPKAYVIIALMFSQFLGDGGPGARVLAISLIFTANNMLAFAIWSAAGDMLARQFRDDTNARRLNLFFGSMLAAVAMWMLIG